MCTCDVFVDNREILRDMMNCFSLLHQQQLRPLLSFSLFDGLKFNGLQESSPSDLLIKDFAYSSTLQFNNKAEVFHP